VRSYHERLSVPASAWWLGMLSAVILASTAWAGFDIYAAIASYAVICGGCAIILLAWGHATIEVRDGVFRAGRATIEVSQLAEATPLDEAQTRALCGPLADPAAFLLTRPYLKTAVYLAPAPGHPGPPYWLIGTRHPRQLAAAIASAHPAAGPTMGRRHPA
jgi:hypothetical protein